MIMNHVNLTVTDVRLTAAFLEKHFGLEDTGGNAGFTVMRDDQGLVLSLMKAHPKTPLQYPGNFHIGFFVESEAKVDEMHAQLCADGYNPPAPERHHAYGFYVDAPGGFSIEVGA